MSSPDPSGILELIEAFRRSKTMFAAVSLGVFDALAAEPKPLGELADELGMNAEALRRLLDACVGLNLLAAVAERYQNSPAATAYLTSASPLRLTGYINYSNAVTWRLWSHLEDAVREGTHRWHQAFGWDGPIFSHFFKTEDAKREFLRGMHGLGLLSSPHVVSAFDLGRFRRLVDLGGASGHLAIAACRHYPHLRAVVFDLPHAVDLAREIVAASPVGERIEIAAGDFFVDPLPEADLFALGRIVHDWSEDKIAGLLARLHDRLPANGAVLIAEKLLLAERSGPRWALMQDLNMLVCTEGRERTLAEYEDLLLRAGFSGVEGRITGGHLDAVLAIKAGQESSQQAIVP